jgi:anti-sigma factor RsiW
MATMNDDSHVGQLLADYSLGLLGASSRERVEGHLAGCEQCRKLLRAEQQLGRDLRQALAHITRPESWRLERARPRLSRRQVGWPVLTAGRQALAPLLALFLVALLWLGSLGLPFSGGGPDAMPPGQATAVIGEARAGTLAAAYVAGTESAPPFQALSMALTIPRPQTPVAAATRPPAAH